MLIEELEETNLVDSFLWEKAMLSYVPPESSMRCMPAVSSFWHVSLDSSSLKPPSMNCHIGEYIRKRACGDSGKDSCVETYILGVDLDRQQELRVVNLLFNAFDDLEQNAGPILETSAVFVGSFINSRRDELRK